MFLISVCVFVRAGSYSAAALLTGGCLAVTLPRAETEMDGHAAVEGQGWRWLSSAPPPPPLLGTNSTDTQTVKDKDIPGIRMIIRKTLLLDMGDYWN